MDGYPPVEHAMYSLESLQFTLHAAKEAPQKMVYVQGGPYAFRGFPPVQLGDYWLDTYEVTNRQFKQFVDAGGYTNPATGPNRS